MSSTPKAVPFVRKAHALAKSFLGFFAHRAAGWHCAGTRLMQGQATTASLWDSERKNHGQHLVEDCSHLHTLRHQKP